MARLTRHAFRPGSSSLLSIEPERGSGAPLHASVTGGQLAWGSLLQASAAYQRPLPCRMPPGIGGDGGAALVAQGSLA
jgi:hypothetical protein